MTPQEKYRKKKYSPATVRYRVLNNLPLDQRQMEVLVLMKDDSLIRTFINQGKKGNPLCNSAEGILYAQRNERRAILNEYASRYELNFLLLKRAMTEDLKLFRHHCNCHLLCRPLQNELLKMSSEFAGPILKVQRSHHWLFPEVETEARRLGWIN